MGAEFGVKGPLMGVLTRELVAWQLAHPEASVEDAHTWLHSRIEEHKEGQQ